MKKNYTVTLLIPFLIVAVNTYSQENSFKNTAEHTSTKETVDYDSRVYNECTSEWVHLQGKATYDVKQISSGRRFFIIYQIDLKQITGIGEKTGAVYKGGGIIRDRVNAIYKNGHVVGNDSYKVIYRAGKTILVYNQKARYVFSGNEVKVSVNDIADYCKTD